MAGRPPDAGEVLARLAEDTGWSRTTVHTYLTRMMARTFVTADYPEPPVLCRPLPGALCGGREERPLADRAYGGSAGRLGGSLVRSGQLDREGAGRSCAAFWTRWRR